MTYSDYFKLIMKFIKKILFFSIFFVLIGCSTFPTFLEREELADQIAGLHAWKADWMSVSGIKFRIYLPEKLKIADSLVVYLEGDGFAWISPTQPSSDPTPIDPVGLKLALAQPEGAAVYLARPCQYIDAEVSRCPSRFWLNERFSLPVVEATSLAIDNLKQRYQAKRIVLVGYSGGGALALLLAARREDVVHVVTVAGNVSPRAWVAMQHLSPLTGSLDPADEIARLAHVPITMLVGEEDSNLPPILAQSFAAMFPLSRQPTVRIIHGFDHHCCWAQEWPSLWRQLS